MAAPKAPTAAPTATAPNAPAAPGTANPGQPEVKKKRDPIVRVTHPLLMPNEKGEATVKLKEWPADYSSVKHKSLTRENFENEALYLNSKAEYHEKQAAKYRQEAADSLTLGGSEERKKVKKARDLVGNLGDIIKDLQAKGIDVTSMMANLNALMAAKAAEAKPAEQAPPATA